MSCTVSGTAALETRPGLPGTGVEKDRSGTKAAGRLSSVLKSE